MGSIIGFVSQKGGVGKWTLARGVGREAAANGLPVKIADLDVQQGTSVKWYRRRREAGVEPIFSVESFKTVARHVWVGVLVRFVVGWRFCGDGFRRSSRKWWTRRSTAARVMAGSGNTLPHSPKGWLAVIIRERRS